MFWKIYLFQSKVSMNNMTPCLSAKKGILCTETSNRDTMRPEKLWVRGMTVK